jgi:hypothetical protein
MGPLSLSGMRARGGFTSSKPSIIWCVTQLSHSSKAELWLDGPGKFLLNPANWVNIGDRKACVSFGIGFDGGRHFRRRAWIEDQLPCRRQGERLNLVWTDNKAKIKRDLVPIMHLNPVHPTRGKEGIVLKGQHQGCLVTVTRFIQSSKMLRLSDSTAAEWEESQENICWVGHPDYR